MCNGLTLVKLITLLVLTQILDITDKEIATQMGSMIQILFETIPVLNLYWQLTKINLKSVCVKRLNVENAKKVLTQLSKTTDGTTTVTKKAQATLTKSDFTKKGSRDSISSIQDASSKTKHDDRSTLDTNKSVSSTKQDSTVDGIIQVSLEKFDAESPSMILTCNNIETEQGFWQPKNPIPFASVKQNYTQSFSQLSATHTNSFANLANDIATEVVKDNEDDDGNVKWVDNDNGNIKQVETKQFSLHKDDSGGVSYDDLSKQSISGSGMKKGSSEQHKHVVQLSKECYPNPNPAGIRYIWL